MTERERKLAFAVAAAVILAAAILPPLLFDRAGPTPESAGDHARPQQAKPKPTVQALGADRPGAPVAPPGAAEARRRAADLIAAYLRYEGREVSPGPAATIERLASSRLADALLAAPARASRDGHAAEAGRLERVERVKPIPAGGFEVFALVRYGKRRGPVYLTIERRSGRWTITALG